MKTFKDTEGREWQIAINVSVIKRVRDLAGIDLLAVFQGEVIDRLISDPILLCDVIYAVCQWQADQRKITDEDFGRAMAGDAIEHATAALLDELVSFSPSPRDRANLGRVLEASRKAMDRARDLVEAELANGALERVVDQALAQVPRTAGALSGNAPASSVPTPGP